MLIVDGAEREQQRVGNGVNPMADWEEAQATQWNLVKQSQWLQLIDAPYVGGRRIEKGVGHLTDRM